MCHDAAQHTQEAATCSPPRVTCDGCRACFLFFKYRTSGRPIPPTTELTAFLHPLEAPLEQQQHQTRALHRPALANN
jgi:hypothetical protein